MTEDRLGPHTGYMKSDHEPTMKTAIGAEALAEATMPGVATAMPATVAIESCHSTWVFDSVRMRFRRVLKDAEVGGQQVATGWRPYYRLDDHPDSETFTVYLNAPCTRMIRSWRRHAEDCTQCGEHGTSEISLEMLRTAISS